MTTRRLLWIVLVAWLAVGPLAPVDAEEPGTAVQEGARLDAPQAPAEGALLGADTLKADPVQGAPTAKPLDGFLKDIPIGPGRLDIGGDFRLRWEYLDNYTIRGYNTGADDDVLLLRTRVGFDYRLGDDAHAYLRFQDARFWLNEWTRKDFAGPCAYQNQVDVLQAFVEWQHIGGSPLGFKLGRQKLAYGDKHIYGPGEWGNVGRYAWDAAKITVDTDDVQVDLMYGQRVLNDPVRWDEKHYDYDMVGVYAQVKKLPARLDLFYTLHYDDHGTTNGEDGAGDRRTHTYGFYLDGTCGPWDYGGTLALQNGAWGRDTIRAWGLNARLGHTFNHPWKPRVGAEFTYGSGDRDPNDGVHGTFDNVFGAVDCFYGRMNLFSWMNLEDYTLMVGVEPAKKCSLWMEYHFFRLAQPDDAWYYCNNRALRRDATGQSGRSLGQEIDLMMKWKLSMNLEVMAGYAHFFPCGFIDDTAGGIAPADWVFVQMMVCF